MTDLIVEDRYSGTYSGGTWLIIEDYSAPLTEDELAWLNNHLAEVDKCYSKMSLEFHRKYTALGLEHDLKTFQSTLELGATRFDAVERTFQNADCYAAWNFDLMPWCVPTNDPVSYFQTKNQERIDEVKSFFSEVTKPKFDDENVKYWVQVYQAEEH